MKNKIKLSLFILLIIGIITFNILHKNTNSKTNKSNLAIMVDETGNGDYTGVSSIPKGSYVLNEEKTVCENGGKVASYNNSTGQIGFSFLGSDRCSLYFEKVEKPTISNVSLSGSTLSATFNSKKSLCCYAITTSTSEPSDWTNINGSSYTLNTSLVTSGTYYLWLKDSYGNVTKYEDAITVNPKGYEIILINNGNGATTIDKAKSYIEEKKTPDFSKISETNDGMFAAEDDLGTSYYFRGAVNNNWVKFGQDNSNKDIYWRIVRINGDGLIRMIYSGTTAPDSSTAVVMTGGGTSISQSLFSISVNGSGKQSEYVGYMYTIGQQHGNSNSNKIKTTVEKWYTETTLKDNPLISQNQIFCNDRSSSSAQTVTWSSGRTYDYGAKGRLNESKNPILTCPTDSDKFTSKDSTIGNKMLDYPVSLITADEVIMAGGGAKNKSYYLFTSKSYWTGSPGSFTGDYATTYYVSNSGDMSTPWSIYEEGVRPVISLSSTVKLSGDGTYTNPYTVS